MKCNICKALKMKDNPNFLGHMNSGVLVFEDSQRQKGHVIFMYDNHVEDIAELNESERSIFFNEAVVVGSFMKDLYKATRINYEILMNKEPHLHMHIIPRYKTDKNPKMPIWINRT